MKKTEHFTNEKNTTASSLDMWGGEKHTFGARLESQRVEVDVEVQEGWAS